MTYILTYNNKHIVINTDRIEEYLASKGYELILQRRHNINYDDVYYNEKTDSYIYAEKVDVINY
jgi:hypothetical protein